MGVGEKTSHQLLGIKVFSSQGEKEAGRKSAGANLDHITIGIRRRGNAELGDKMSFRGEDDQKTIPAGKTTL